jgi:hypothetical protein
MNTLLSWIQPPLHPYTIESIYKFDLIIEQLRINGREFTFIENPQAIYTQLDPVWASKFENVIERPILNEILELPILKEVGHLLIQKYPFEVCYIHSNKKNDRIVVINYNKWVK